MELLDRYLHAVKFWLPKTQKQDIIAELSEDIRSQIEEKEAELGRNLSEAEAVAILKQVGSPLFVATRFLPQQYLIGPLLFPIYQFVLKILALCYLIPWVLVWIGLMIFSQNYRAEHYSRGLIATVGSLWSPVWFGAFIATGVVTIVFAVLERTHAQTGFLENWDPRKLPPVRDPNQIPLSSSIIELVVGVLFTGWWISAMRSPAIVDRSTVQITLAPVWRYFFWGFLLISLVNIALAGMNLLHPYWTRIRAGIRLASDCVGSALFCWLLKSNILADLAVPNVSASKTLAITNAINMWASRAFSIAFIVCVVIAAFNIRRIFQVTAGKRDPSMPAAAAPLILN